VALAITFACYSECSAEHFGALISVYVMLMTRLVFAQVVMIQDAFGGIVVLPVLSLESPRLAALVLDILDEYDAL
jgi:hypothetical protein